MEIRRIENQTKLFLNITDYQIITLTLKYFYKKFNIV